jgi:uncharacterized protein with GYD domain
MHIDGDENMVTAVAIVGVTPGRERSIYYNLKNNDGVLDIYHIFGEYDFLMILQADGLQELNQLVDSILGMRGITVIRTILIGWDSGMQSHRPIHAST